MTPLDRAALADALASASPETLRRIAEEHHAVAITLDEFDDPSAAFKAQANDHRIVAALALAVAAMQERGFGVDAAWYGPDDNPVWFDTNTRPDEASGVNTLPAALAALLKGDQ